MTMHALLRRDPCPTPSAIEDAFDGHICRCTGYRAILDAMQSFAADRDAAGPTLLRAHRPVACAPCRPERKAPGPAHYRHGSDRWCRVISLQELGQAWSKAKRNKLHEGLRLVAGNTAAALDKEPDGKPRFIVDISAVPELNVVEDGSANGARGLVLGGAVSFARAIAEFDARATDDAYAASAERFRALSAHLCRAANAQVRNRATLGGHLGMYLAHRRSSRSPFLSDLLPLLVALEAQVRYAATPDDAPVWMALEEFLETDLKTDVSLPVVHAFAVHGIAASQPGAGRANREEQSQPQQHARQTTA